MRQRGIQTCVCGHKFDCDMFKDINTKLVESDKADSVVGSLLVMFPCCPKCGSIDMQREDLDESTS